MGHGSLQVTVLPREIGALLPLFPFLLLYQSQYSSRASNTLLSHRRIDKNVMRNLKLQHTTLISPLILIHSNGASETSASVRFKSHLPEPIS